MNRTERIRDLYRTKKSPFDDIWAYCKAGKSKRERYRRFRAARDWARDKKQPGNRDGDTKAQWEARRKAYAREARKILRRINDAPTLGEGSWGGSESIIDATVLQVFIRHGIPRTSAKRWETFGNPGSDHWMGNLLAFARDGGIANAQWLHGAITEEFRKKGIPLDAGLSDYANRYCTASGRRFRIQGIASTHGTGPHYHGGCRRA